MLQFVIGTAGTGKTTRIFKKMEACVRAGGKVILLVPEQLSFESEKHLYRALGPQLALGVEVLSFTRLCNSIFRAYGGLADTPVTPAAKYLLMSIAVEELRDSLTVYRKSLGNTAFLQTLVEICAEFKTAGVQPEQLSAAAEDCGHLLADKLRELAGIYGAYQSLLERGYTDADDDIIRACMLLESKEFFAGMSVFVDGFTTFMAAEFELLGHMIAQADAVTFAMTCDSLADRQHGMGVFSPVKAAVQRLQKLAERGGAATAATEILEEQHRFRHEALGHLALAFLQPGAAAFEGQMGEAVSLYRADDRYSEMEYVAASIVQLARERGMRYREIAVVARDTGPYLRALEAVFTRYGIPCFTDLPSEVENHPLVAGLLYAVDAVRSNFGTESILLLAKSPIMGIDAELVAKLENYCYCWDVRGAVWQQDFVANPRGLAGAPTEEDLVLLGEINGVRGLLVEPLLRLKEALFAGTGRQFATGLYTFLVAVGTADNLTKYAGAFPQDIRSTFLGESAQIWDAVVDILDIFGSVLGDVHMGRARLCELLRLALGTAEVAMPPQTLDQVLVGKADRIRPVGLRAVFVIGAVEGEFPAQIGQAGVFSDAERKQMIDAGVEISAPSLQQSVLETFFAYFALTLASEQLTVSWPRADLGGQELLPSVIVSQLEHLFPALRPDRPDRMLFAQGDASAFALLSREYGRGTELEAALREYFADGGRQADLARLEQARRRPPFHLSHRGYSRALFGERMRLSPTRVERYYRCPFSYFAADGLRLKKRQKVEFSPLESGSVIHNVLQVMVQRHGGRGLAELDEKQMQGEIAEIIRAYLTDRVEDVDKLPTRFRYLFTRLSGMLARLLRHIDREFQQSEFVPAAFELPITAREGVEPLQLETADGVQVTVEGIVDRVDIMEKGGKRYVRVVDYKSGAKSFALGDILYGLNMQMLLYLFTIQEHGEESLSHCIPAGVLYMPVRERFVNAAREGDDEKIAAEREKQWKMSGLLLEDEEALRGMERELKGIFIPAKLGKNGLDAKSSLAGKAEMGRLSRKVKELIVQMAAALSEGGVQAVPTFSEDLQPCKYCDYRAVCGYEQGDPVREIAKMDRKAVLELLEQQEAPGEEI